MLHFQAYARESSVETGLRARNIIIFIFMFLGWVSSVLEWGEGRTVAEKLLLILGGCAFTHQYYTVQPWASGSYKHEYCRGSPVSNRTASTVLMLVTPRGPCCDLQCHSFRVRLISIQAIQLPNQKSEWFWQLLGTQTRIIFPLFTLNTTSPSISIDKLL